jgi:hypothetical protein
MDMQKMKVRADLERMVYNYALLGKIENDTADKIVSFIGLTIGGGDLTEPRCRIIAFPSPVTRQPEPVERRSTSELDESERRVRMKAAWRENFEGIDFGANHSRILDALYDLRINSLGELAETPPDKIKEFHGIGEKSLAVIRSVIEKNGFTAWDIAL